MLSVYYNELDPKAAEWLRALAKSELIPQGEVDARSIEHVTPENLVGFIQCHFFAGIGGWPYALRLAGWPATRPVWTGSCPCQPFSCAGKGQGEKDPRHLWPQFRRLIAECHPPTVFGEQVASKAGREWLSRVRADLEALGYAVGAADLCAAGEAAPHIRQRLFWVGHANGTRCRERGVEQRESRSTVSSEGSDVCGMGNTAAMRRSRSNGSVQHFQGPGEGCADGRLPDAACLEFQGQPSARNEFPDRPDGEDVSGVAVTERNGRRIDQQEQGPQGRVADGRSGPWTDYRTVTCRDIDKRTGKQAIRRIPVESAFFPLAPGLPGRVAQLRGLGNAIVPQVAATFIQAFLETELNP